jgi:hypothetical protein
VLHVQCVRNPQQVHLELSNRRSPKQGRPSLIMTDDEPNISPLLLGALVGETSSKEVQGIACATGAMVCVSSVIAAISIQ